jgi:hypothetical protein
MGIVVESSVLEWLVELPLFCVCSCCVFGDDEELVGLFLESRRGGRTDDLKATTTMRDIAIATTVPMICGEWLLISPHPFMLQVNRLDDDKKMGSCGRQGRVLVTTSKGYLVHDSPQKPVT